MHIERKLGYNLWKLVDWAAGTSTGGVLSLALANGKFIYRFAYITRRIQHFKLSSLRKKPGRMSNALPSTEERSIFWEAALQGIKAESDLPQHFVQKTHELDKETEVS